MAYYTSYYGSREIPEDGIRVSISVSSPAGVRVDERLSLVAPAASVLWGYKDGRVSREEYISSYARKLDADKDKVVAAISGLEKKYSGKDIYLLCWEAPGKFCHRHLLADWMGKNLGIAVEEYGEQARRQVESMGLRQGELPFGERRKSLAIVGSRSFDDYSTMKCYLQYEFGREWYKEFGTIISGGARGADSLAERLAGDYGLEMKVFPADWDRYGKSAGFRRNEDIVKACDVCVAFWDGESHGTKHDIDLAGQMGKELHVCRYRGWYKELFEDVRPLQEAYGKAVPTKEVVTGELAKDFVGPVSWSRALDFDAPGFDGFRGLRYMDFKDCTNVYALMKDGESCALEVLSKRQLQCLRVGLAKVESDVVDVKFDSNGCYRYYDGNVPVIDDVVFCFGSNPVGINGNPERGTGGAALVAHKEFGVRQGECMDNCMSASGRAYGIVTVTYPGKKNSLSLEQIAGNFRKMFVEAEKHPDKYFCVAYRHLDKPSLCGYTGYQMIDAIKDLRVPDNVVFSKEWATELASLKRNVGVKI